MGVYQLDPIRDPRWMGFVSEHPDSSVFHSPNWLRALQATYSYHPFAITTSPPGAKLRNGILFCRVESWLTGNRLVSVPFADHCELLVDDAKDRHELLGFIASMLRRAQFKYAELRPIKRQPEDNCGFRQSLTYAFHTLDLRPELDEILKKSHKSSIQQKIRRAQRQQLDYTEGNDSRHIHWFYQLLLLTRRRQRIPPQPLEWFHNLAEYFADSLEIRLLLKGGRPIAGVLTLRWKNTVVDKYSCSDAHSNNLGCIPLLLWRVIEHAKKLGISTFDFGRSDCEAKGLVEFKDRWGSQRGELKYWRLPGESLSSRDDWKLRVAGPIFARMPDPLLAASGRMLYRHIG
jgi:CelD/BcsL family acetyltransferase involved in cellulose biosynthesis